MAIDENYRGMGIGHKMLDFIKEIKKEKNLDGIELQVNVPVEDDHEFVWVEYSELVGNMYLEIQRWALKQCVGVVDL